MKFNNLYPSKLLPLAIFPFRVGPEADRDRALFKTGSDPTSLTEGFFEMLFLKGLSPLGTPFLI